MSSQVRILMSPTLSTSSRWRICGQAALPSNFRVERKTLSSGLLTATCVTCVTCRQVSPQGFHGFHGCFIFSPTPRTPRTPRHLVSSKHSKTHLAMFFRDHVAQVAHFKVLNMLNCVPGKLFDVYVLVGSLSQTPKPSKGNRSYTSSEALLAMFKGQFICGYSCLWVSHLEHSVSTTFQRIQLHLPKFQTATLLTWRKYPLSKHG